MATDSGILVWRITGTEEPGRLHRAAVHGVAQSQTRLKRLSSSRTTRGNLPAASAEIEHCAAEVDCLQHPLREIRVENKVL